MPYEGELANKNSHRDIVQSPDIKAFLANCEFLKEPSNAEGQGIGAKFVAPPPCQTHLPEHVIAVDGSFYEASIDERLPSTKVGYLKIGAILISLAQYGALREQTGRLVDPFKVATLMNNNTSLAVALPSANVRMKGKPTVVESFRAAVDDYLVSETTRFSKTDPGTSLRSTLFHVASKRSGPLGTGDPTRLKLHRCPNPSCDQAPVELTNVLAAQACPKCHAQVYPSDCLRVWEGVTEFQSSIEAVSRLMSIVEHLMPIHYARFVMSQSPAALSSLAFFVDGPLAVFGNAAWIHAAIMRWLYEARAALTAMGKPQFLLLGLQKSGQVADHVSLIDRYIASNSIYSIEDEYRYKYIITSRDPSANGFGSETYYGQDFIYKTPSGRTFVLSLPYPFATKQLPGLSFAHAKTDVSRYPDLARVLALIHHFESDLYENAVVPVALAHRYTAISLQPGGRILDLLTHQQLFPDH